MAKYLLLGYGYTARVIEEVIKANDPNAEIFKTSRQGSPAIKFNMHDRESWQKLPSVDGTFWTFPAEPEGEVKTFLDHYQDRLGKIVVIGSTSGFVITQEHQEVTEKTPVNIEVDRVKGEVDIRKARGIVVAAAGIYGPGRNPVDWVRKGWVGPSTKFLNTIHVRDLANICWAAMHKGQPSAIYLAADGQPHTWNELIERWSAQYGAQVHETAQGSKRQSKKVNSQQTLAELGVQLIYPDIFVGVSELEA